MQKIVTLRYANICKSWSIISIFVTIYAKRDHICLILSKMSYILYQIAQLMLISMEYFALV